MDVQGCSLETGAISVFWNKNYNLKYFYNLLMQSAFVEFLLLILQTLGIKL